MSFDSKKTVGKTTTIVEMLKNESTLTPAAPKVKSIVILTSGLEMVGMEAMQIISKMES